MPFGEGHEGTDYLATNDNGGSGTDRSRRGSMSQVKHATAGGRRAKSPIGVLAPVFAEPAAASAGRRARSGYSRSSSIAASSFAMRSFNAASSTSFSARRSSSFMFTPWIAASATPSGSIVSIVVSPRPSPKAA